MSVLHTSYPAKPIAFYFQPKKGDEVAGIELKDLLIFVQVERKLGTAVDTFSRHIFHIFLSQWILKNKLKKYSNKVVIIPLSCKTLKVALQVQTCWILQYITHASLQCQEHIMLRVFYNIPVFLTKYFSPFPLLFFRSNLSLYHCSDSEPSF